MTAENRAIRTATGSAAAFTIGLEQKDNYPMMMRIAMLSSMKASYSSAMGFRCAVDGARP